MLGIDERLAQLAPQDALLALPAVAVLLGVRHATDPDHLTAVTTLVTGGEDRGSRRAALLGLAWGLGHATTLTAFGLPVVLFAASLPERAQHGAEAVIGVVMIALALRLLIRWRHGHFHVHAHRHREVEHRHLHRHAGADTRGHAGHGHQHPVLAGRLRRQAYAIGLLHGVDGSGGTGVLVLAGLPDHGLAIAGLILFAVGTAASMAALSSCVGLALEREPILTRMRLLAPALGAFSLAFGSWYTAGALQLA